MFSACRRYRYTLTRVWARGGRTCVWVMLNPSSADAREDDPTIRRCVDFSKRWGCSSLLVVNLFAWIETDSAKLAVVADPVGPDNERVLDGAMEHASLLVAAWGTKGTMLGRDRSVLRRMRGACALRLTKDGHPEHPLYVPADIELVPFGQPKPSAHVRGYDVVRGERGDVTITASGTRHWFPNDAAAQEFLRRVSA